MATAFDYSGLVTVANDLISSFGRTATLARATRVPSGAKPWLAQQGAAAVSGAQTFSVKIVETAKAHAHRPAEDVKSTAKIIFMSVETALPEEIDTDWQIIDGGITYQVRSIRVVAPGGTLIVYRLELE